MFPQWFKDYLSFHRSERNAIVVLLIALFGLIGFNMYQRFFWKGDWEEIELEYGPLIVRFEEQTDSIIATRESDGSERARPLPLFAFDPNTLDSIGWVSLGFSPKQSAAIIKYRSAGAVFRKPEDVKKLFVVDEEKYDELYPYIEIQPLAKSELEPMNEDWPKRKNPIEEHVIVELNTADSTQLVRLKGIGPSYSKRIIKYRELLGGYLSADQLLEVYGMDSSRYLPLLESIKVDTAVRTRININQADVKELLRHPYINLNMAKAMVNYREQHGDYDRVSDLQNIHLLKGETYRKIAPYLTTPDATDPR